MVGLVEQDGAVDYVFSIPPYYWLPSGDAEMAAVDDARKLHAIAPRRMLTVKAGGGDRGSVSYASDNVSVIGLSSGAPRREIAQWGLLSNGFAAPGPSGPWAYVVAPSMLGHGGMEAGSWPDGFGLPSCADSDDMESDRISAAFGLPGMAIAMGAVVAGAVPDGVSDIACLAEEWMDPSVGRPDDRLMPCLADAGSGFASFPFELHWRTVCGTAGLESPVCRLLGLGDGFKADAVRQTAAKMIPSALGEVMAEEGYCAAGRAFSPESLRAISEALGLAVPGNVGECAFGEQVHLYKLVECGEAGGTIGDEAWAEARRISSGALLIWDGALAEVGGRIDVERLRGLAYLEDGNGKLASVRRHGEEMGIIQAVHAFQQGVPLEDILA